MTRNQFVREINNGHYENYHVRNINVIDTFASNPDSTRNNNQDKAYIINKNAQNNGDHEVHKKDANCQDMPNLENQIDLG